MDDLTPTQELFVSLVASEQIKLQAKMAGAEIKDSPRRRKKKGADEYGEILERRQRFKELDLNSKEIIESCSKPL